MKLNMRMVSAAVVAVLFLFGPVGTILASSDQIELKYEMAGIDEATCTKSVAIVTFEDKRDDVGIGESGKGKKFYSKNPVNEWFTRALYDELKRTGCKTEYHDKDGEFGTDFTIAGVVEEAYIIQKSMTKYHVTMRLNLSIYQDGKKLLGKTFSINLERTTAPSFSFNNKLATQMLQEMMRDIVPQLHKKFE